MEKITLEHSRDKQVQALEITLEGGPANNHTFFAYPGRVSDIFTVGLLSDNSQHFYAYDVQNNTATYLGEQHDESTIHPVLTWATTTEEENTNNDLT